MNTEFMRQIADNGCAVVSISAHRYNRTTIVPHTTRQKGQYAIQRLFYIVGGVTKFVLDDGTEVVCERGDIVYLPPDITYVSVWEENEENAAILLLFDLLSEGEEICLSDRLCLIAHDSTGGRLELFSQLATTFQRGGVGYRIKCQALLLEILYSILTEHLQVPARGRDSAVYRGILYIENHYLETIDVNALASMCSLCPSAFRSHFHEAVGMSPIRYKNYLMMQRAAELLRTGTLTVSEVALTLGINDIYYFNRLFKSVYGTPPGRFAKREK